jgi:O-antigen/teichoic acid export membrane protein
MDDVRVNSGQLLREPAGEFRTDHLTADLGARAARGGAVTIVSQGVKVAVTVSGTVILARLLTPQDYGLIGMVAVVTGFVSVYKDLGLGSATIQKPTISDDQVSTLFWVNVVLSLAVTCVCIAIAPLLSWFYRDSRLTWVTVVSAFGFTLGGLAVQHEALLRRQMRFVTLSVIGVLAMVVGYAVGILLARRGYQYRALVFSQLALVGANTIAIWIACRWRPLLPKRHTGVRSMIRFGANLTGFSTINYFARNLDNFLIGKFWGPSQLGLYGRAYQLMMLPIDQINEPVTAVAVPALSRLSDPDGYCRAYLRILAKIALITMPAATLMMVCSDWIVSVLLGPRWTDVSPLLTVLAISGLVQPIANTTGWLFITQGRTGEMFRFSMIAGPIIMLSIVAGLHWGAIGVAVSYVSAKLCLADPLLYWYVGRRGPVRTLDFYRTIWPVAAASGGGGLASLAFRAVVRPSSALVGLLECAAITGAVTLLGLLLTSAGRRTLRDVMETMRLVAGQPRKPARNLVGS